MDKDLKPNLDKQSTKTIAPHFPGGVMTPDDLRKIADLCEKYPESKIKLSGDLIIGGITDPERNAEGRKLLRLPTYNVSGFSIRPIKICSGGYLCDNNVQDSFSLGLNLDRIFTNKPLPSKLIIAVSGCGRNCSEPLVKDIGIVSTPGGYSVYVGGTAGAKPRIAQKIIDQLNEIQVIALVEKIVSVYESKGKARERLGSLIEKMGMEKFKAECGIGNDQAGMLNTEG
jgi:NAD(P)H-nitrite reductase large subunit